MGQRRFPNGNENYNGGGGFILRDWAWYDMEWPDCPPVMNLGGFSSGGHMFTRLPPSEDVGTVFDEAQVPRRLQYYAKLDQLKADEQNKAKHYELEMYKIECEEMGIVKTLTHALKFREKEMTDQVEHYIGRFPERRAASEQEHSQKTEQEAQAREDLKREAQELGIEPEAQENLEQEHSKAYSEALERYIAWREQGDADELDFVVDHDYDSN